LLLAIVHPLCGSMHVVRPSVVLILVLPLRSSQSSDSARILTYPPFGISRSKNQFISDIPSFRYLSIHKPIYADFCMHFSFRQKQKVINGQQFGRRFPLHPPFYSCWTILVGRISPGISPMKWTGVQPVALRLGVIVFAPFQI